MGLIAKLGELLLLLLQPQGTHVQCLCVSWQGRFAVVWLLMLMWEQRERGQINQVLSKGARGHLA